MRHLILLGLLTALATSGCGLRTIPPIRYVPLMGKEREVRTTEVLMRALRDRDVAVRAEAVDLLGVLAASPDRGTKKDVARVLGAALRDRDPGLRLQAVEQLGKMEPKYANKFLRLALTDPNPFVRAKVLVVLELREKQRLQATAATP